MHLLVLHIFVILGKKKEYIYHEIFACAWVLNVGKENKYFNQIWIIIIIFFNRQILLISLVKDIEDLSDQDIYIWLKYWETLLQVLSQIVLSPL